MSIKGTTKGVRKNIFNILLPLKLELTNEYEQKKAKKVANKDTENATKRLFVKPSIYWLSVKTLWYHSVVKFLKGIIWYLLELKEKIIITRIGK